MLYFLYTKQKRKETGFQANYIGFVTPWTELMFRFPRVVVSNNKPYSRQILNWKVKKREG